MDKNSIDSKTLQNELKINQFNILDKISVCKECEDIVIPIGKDNCSGLLCFNQTTTMIAKYCYYCAQKNNRCYICGINLKKTDNFIDTIIDFFTF